MAWPSDLLRCSHSTFCPAGAHDPAEDARQKKYVDAIDAHNRGVRDRPAGTV